MSVEELKKTFEIFNDPIYFNFSSGIIKLEEWLSMSLWRIARNIDEKTYNIISDHILNMEEIYFNDKVACIRYILHIRFKIFYLTVKQIFKNKYYQKLNTKFEEYHKKKEIYKNIISILYQQ